MIEYNDIHEAYLHTLAEVMYKYDFRSSPRGQPIRELVDYGFKVNEPIAEPIKTKDIERNKVIETYTKKEWDLYDSQTNLVSDFAKASKFWNKIANKDGTVNSAYGYLIWNNKSCGNLELDDSQISELMTPWEWCKYSLIKDKDSRQAHLKFNLPQHLFTTNKDVTCTMHMNMLIREDKLHASLIMRSNDVMLGAVYDIPWFISLIDRMVLELKERYPNLEKGTYTHFAHSMHMYERDQTKILKMLGK